MPVVDERAARAGSGRRRSAAALRDAVLDHAADHVELALEGVLLEARAPRATKTWRMRGIAARAMRRSPSGRPALAPAEQALALVGDDALDGRDLPRRARPASGARKTMPTAYAPAAGSSMPSARVSLRRNASGSWISMPAPSPVSGSQPQRAAVLQVLEHLDAAAHDRVRSLRPRCSRRSRRRRRRARSRVVQALLRRQSAVAASSRSPSRSARRRRRSARRAARATRVVPARAATRVRSTCVDSTTIVSVRVTPSIERMRVDQRARAPPCSRPSP